MLGRSPRIVCIPGSRELDEFCGTCGELSFPEDPTRAAGSQQKGSVIRLVQKACGGGPAKSLKVEAAKTSNRLVRKVKVLDRSFNDALHPSPQNWRGHSSGGGNGIDTATSRGLGVSQRLRLPGWKSSQLDSGASQSDR